VRRLALHLVPALALAAAAAAPRPAAAEEPSFPVPLESLRGRLETQAPYAIGPSGLEIPVDGNVPIGLPFAAEVIELDVEASGPVLLTHASQSPGVKFRAFGPPWRHVTLPRERRTVVLDQRVTDGWTAQARPTIALTGVGRVIVHGLRIVPVSRDREELVGDYDRALRWAPEAPAHTTINLLTPSYWKASEGLWLSDVVAGVGAAAAAALLAIVWLRRRRLAVAGALAAGSLVAAVLWDAHLLVRFLPAFRLQPTLDREQRIRDGYDVAPDVGALAALARATLRPDERVGVVASQGNWFTPQTLCFDLAPRPCVTMVAGAPQAEYRGISLVGVLRADQIDAVVAYRAGPLPDGFTPVASLGKSAVIARRRP
jgi:hypothetical protein